MPAVTGPLPAATCAFGEPCSQDWQASETPQIAEALTAFLRRGKPKKWVDMTSEVSEGRRREFGAASEGSREA